MRLTHSLAIHASRDEAQVQSHFVRDAVLSKATLDLFTSHSDGTFTIVAAASEVLSLGGITSPAKGLYIEVDENCSVYLNGSGDPIQLRKETDATYAKLFIEANITSVTITASEGEAVAGTYLMWGDLT